MKNKKMNGNTGFNREVDRRLSRSKIISIKMGVQE